MGKAGRVNPLLEDTVASVPSEETCVPVANQIGNDDGHRDEKVNLRLEVENVANGKEGDESETLDVAKTTSDSKEDMDMLLLKSFLQAAKTTLKQDDKAGWLKIGPLAPDVFYSQHVRPARPANSSVDVHKSSYKKLPK